jgi:hypothetical protein
MEYTRLDQIIDVMFTTATDVQPVFTPERESSIELDDKTEADAMTGKGAKASDAAFVKGTWEFTDSRLLQGKREAILQSVGQSIGTTLIKKSRALYWDATHNARVACSISKRYLKSDANRSGTGSTRSACRHLLPTVDELKFDAHVHASRL